ncbi:NifU family protein [Mycobacterium sp. UM_CSW]|uniref:NifU family protein n=1 Tax=Mycobacterium sp. UM_CSW TaxID=1370119 RepID=UPI00040B26FB|nr:NifU family protein [Mycobacterium sp. UM_CSW]
MADRPTSPVKGPENDTQWRAAGDRIQTLLDSCAASGAAAHERAQQLVREVVGLYGAALERIVRAGDAGFAERLATDDLVASLLLVHGLHPHDLRRRVSDALDRVRPYLGSHGGDVDLLEVLDDGTVRLAFKGSCKSCPSSAVTLELAVEDAVRAAAPEVTSIEVVTAEPAANAAVIPTESLMAHVRSNGHSPNGAGTWHPLPELAELEPGDVAGFRVAGTALLVCRVGDLPLAYRDHCPVCDDSLAGARLNATLLGCPRCGTQFDVVHAGAGPDGTHLEPLPLLPRDGVPSVALPEPMEARA